MGMNLSETDIVKLLPQWMRGDEANIGLAKGTNPLFASVGLKVPTLRTWDQIDNLEEAELDELAWEMNIDWYDTNMSITQKRAIVKSAGSVIQKRGTKYAVSEVVNTAFGEGEVLEWFDYEGEPHHFKIWVDASVATRFDPDYIRKMLNKVKPASAHLDEIVFALTAIFYIQEKITADEIEIGYKNYIYNLEKLDGSRILDGTSIMNASAGFIIDIDIISDTNIPEKFEFESEEEHGGAIPEHAEIKTDLGILFSQNSKETQTYEINNSAAVQETPIINEYTLTITSHYTELDGSTILNGSVTMNSIKTEEVL